MRPHRSSSHAPRMALAQDLGMQVARRRGGKRRSCPGPTLVVIPHRSWIVPLTQGSRYGGSLKEDYWVPRRRKSAPRGNDGRREFAGNVVPLCRTMFRLFCLILLSPSCGGRNADLGGQRELRDTACIRWRSLPAGLRRCGADPFVAVVTRQSVRVRFSGNFRELPPRQGL